MIAATSPARPSTVKLVLAFAAVYLIWGSTYLGIKYAIETLPPMLMAGVRFSFAGALLYAWLRWRGAPRPTSVHWRSAIIVGGLLLMGGNGLICWAQQHVPSGLSALLVATVPLWIVLLGWLLFRGQRPTVLISAGLAVGLLGVLILIDPAKFRGDSLHPLGAVAILAACLSWSIGSLYLRKAPLPSSVFLATAMEMIGGGVLLVIAGSLRGEWAAFNPQAISLQSTLAFFYLVIFGSLIGFSAYIWLLKTVSPAAVSTYAYVNPVVAVFLGWAIAKEQITGGTVIAAALIIAAVALITTRRAAPVNPEEEVASIGLNVPGPLKEWPGPHATVCERGSACDLEPKVKPGAGLDPRKNQAQRPVMNAIE